MQTRDASADDRETVASILRAANEEFASLGGAPTQEDIDALFGRLHVAKLIVVLRDVMEIGCVAYFPPASVRGPDEELDSLVPREHAYVGWLAVVPSERQAGVGRALAQECVDRARADGASAVELFTAPYMTAAQRLYERLGFVRLTSDEGIGGMIHYMLAL